MSLLIPFKCTVCGAALPHQTGSGRRRVACAGDCAAERARRVRRVRNNASR